MKNSKFLKLISLALTVALLVAVAVPTLTTSAEDTTPEYVTDLTVDFEDDADSAFGTIVTDETTGNKYWQIPVATVGIRKFKNVLLKAGHTYWFSFDYYITVNTSSDSVAWFKPCYADGTQYGPTYASTAGEWKNFTGYFTPTTDTTFSIVTDDGVGIDDFRIIDFSNSVSGKTAVYSADDGVADLENEVLIYPESNYRTVTYTYDSGIGKNIASFRLTKTDQHLGFMVPFQFKAGKKYSIKFNYYSDGNSVAANPYSFRVQAGSDLDASDANNKTIGWVGLDTPAWTTASLSFSPTADYFGLHFDAHRTDNCYIDVKIHSLSIVEQSTENTATKQVYNFDAHDFTTYTDQTNGNKSIVIAEKDGKKTLALKANCTDTAVAQVNPKLDMALTAGKYYKMSYDVKGKGNIAITMTSGGWSDSQYKTEMFGTEATGLVIDTANWKHRSTVFSAKYNSTHMYIRVTAGTEVYFDNITIEEYTPFEQEMATFDDGYESANGYSVVDDPVAENVGNKVLKNNNSSFQYFVLNSARFVPGHTYEVSFKYYGTAWFRPDITSTTFNTVSPVTSYQGISPTTTWKTARYIITATDAMNMSTFAVMCNGTVYFDNFTITDISNFDADDESLDYSSDSGAFITTNSVATVTKEVDDRDETKKVTKITFSNSSHYDNSKISIPFALQKDKTYKIQITYKANTFVAISWDDKSLGDAGLGATNSWTTATRYAKGTTGDMPYFAVPKTDTGTELYIADITITEATAEGGLNGDGVIDAKDYNLFRGRFFTGKRDDTTHFNRYADQNSDGTVDVLDMVLLSKIGK